jgi:hypothetical protein
MLLAKDILTGICFRDEGARYKTSKPTNYQSTTNKI